MPWARMRTDCGLRARAFSTSTASAVGGGAHRLAPVVGEREHLVRVGQVRAQLLVVLAENGVGFTSAAEIGKLRKSAHGERAVVQPDAAVAHQVRTHEAGHQKDQGWAAAASG